MVNEQQESGLFSVVKGDKKRASLNQSSKSQAKPRVFSKDKKPTTQINTKSKHKHKNKHKQEQNKPRSLNKNVTLSINRDLSAREAMTLIVANVMRGMSLTNVFSIVLEHVDQRDRGLIKEVSYGTLRHYRLLEQTLSNYLKEDLKEKFLEVKCCLLTAFYQLSFLKLKSHAVVNESVNVCHLLKFSAMSKLVNAILRGFLRHDCKLIESDDLAIKYSFPDYMVKKLTEDYGDKTESILKHSNEQAPLWLRVHQSKISIAKYHEILKKENIAFGVSKFCPEALFLHQALDVKDIPLFYEGAVSVQDVSAQMAAHVLPKLLDNAKILDCCSAPGGKAAHIFDLYPHCELSAFDVDVDRLKLVAQTFERLHVNAEIKLYDARKLHELEESYDLILIDAPCSGSGVIRRHADIKWLRQEEDIVNLVALQQEILDSACSRVVENGYILYTTCSIFKEENEEQITSFLQRHSNFKVVEFSYMFQKYPFYQRLCGEDNGDGFFYALMQYKA